VGDVLKLAGRMNSRRRLLPFIAQAGLAAAALYLIGLVTDLHWLRLAAKPIVPLALAGSVLIAGRGRYAAAIAAALLFCLLGDVLLEIGGLFLFGLAAFLIAHLLFLAAFLLEARRPSLLLLLPVAALGLIVFRIILPGLGEMVAPVVLYLAAIVAMMWRGAARAEAGRSGRWSGWASLVGALAFGFSDSLLALDRFHEPFAGARYAVILTYWLALLLLAASAVAIRPAGEELEPAAIRPR
jgi:uncharacterized membrane protein YhhN